MRLASQVRQPATVLVAALLLVELLAGMQVYLSSTVTPLLAAELSGQHLYGVAAAAGLVASFVTMPLGGSLLARWSASSLVGWLTLGSIAGAAVCGVAPSMEVFIAGRVVSGLAAGAIATVGMGVIVSSLPLHWRRLVLASYNVVWLVSSLVGPAYAAWISHWLSWRWAMVAYLPLLLIARLLIARQLRRVPTPPGREGDLPWREGLLLAGGVALISALAFSPTWGWIPAIAGLAAIAAASQTLFPRSVMLAAPGQPAAVAGLALLAGIFFGASSVAAIVAHDVLGFTELQLGILLSLGGIGWAVTGLWCGKRAVPRFTARANVGVTLLVSGLLLMATAGAAPAYILGWLLAGLGMGLAYLDLLNRGVAGDHPDLPESVAPTAVILAETIPTAIAMTLTASIVAIDPAYAPWTFAGLAALAFGLPPLIRRADVTNC